MKSLLIASSVFIALASAAFAAGESSAPSVPPTGAAVVKPMSPKAMKCKKGEVIKSVTKYGTAVKSCVKSTAGILSDDELYDQGRMLAKEGEYDWALTVLAQIENQNQPRVLNYTGYSHRKAGRFELGFSYYQKALAIDPNFVLAREYLGEGYVAIGKIDQAKLQLNEIAQRRGTSCEEYIDLNKAIHDANI